MKQCVLGLFLVSLMFSSCQKTDQSPLLNVIPKDAKFVLTVNKEQLIKKGGLDHLKNFSFYEKARMAAAETGINLEENFLLNSSKRGLGLKDAYIFMQTENENFRFVYLTGMKDQILFENNVRDVLNKLNEEDDPAPEIQDKLSYKMLKNDDGEITMAWNDKLFFVFVGSTEDINYDAYFRRSAEESLMAVADFKQFSERTSDIGLWLSMQMYVEFVEQAAKYSSIDMSIPVIDDMAGMNMHTYLDFKDNEITFETIMTPEEQMDTFYEKYPVLKWESDQNMLKDFPAASYFALKAAFDLPQYVKILKENMLGMPEMAEVVDILENPEIADILDILGGELMFSLYGFSDGPMSLPLLGLSFTVNGDEGFQKVLAMIPQEMVYDNGKYYDLSTGFVGVHFAYKDNRVFVTDDEKAIQAFIAGGNAKNITANATIGKVIKSSPMLFYINLNLDDYPSLIRESLSGFVPQEAIATLDIFKDFSVYMTSKYSTQMSLKFKSDKENSLKQLITLADKSN